MVQEVRNIRREVLPNGLILITEEMEHIRSASIGIWIKTGSRDEDLQWTGHGPRCLYGRDAAPGRDVCHPCGRQLQRSDERGRRGLRRGHDHYQEPRSCQLRSR